MNKPLNIPPKPTECTLELKNSRNAYKNFLDSVWAATWILVGILLAIGLGVGILYLSEHSEQTNGQVIPDTKPQENRYSLKGDRD